MPILIGILWVIWVLVWILTLVVALAVGSGVFEDGWRQTLVFLNKRYKFMWPVYVLGLIAILVSPLALESVVDRRYLFNPNGEYAGSIKAGLYGDRYYHDLIKGHEVRKLANKGTDLYILPLPHDRQAQIWYKWGSNNLSLLEEGIRLNAPVGMEPKVIVEHVLSSIPPNYWTTVVSPEVPDLVGLATDLESRAQIIRKIQSLQPRLDEFGICISDVRYSMRPL